MLILARPNTKETFPCVYYLPSFKEGLIRSVWWTGAGLNYQDPRTPSRPNQSNHKDFGSSTV